MPAIIKREELSARQSIFPFNYCFDSYPSDSLVINIEKPSSWHWVMSVALFSMGLSQTNREWDYASYIFDILPGEKMNLRRLDRI
jgi:hypothetical protein